MHLSQLFRRNQLVFTCTVLLNNYCFLLSAGLMSPTRQAPSSLMPAEDPWATEPAIPRGSKGTNKYGDEGFE